MKKAYIRRMAISRAVLQWVNDAYGIRPDECDVDLEKALLVNGVLFHDDIVEDMWSDSSNDVLTMRLGDGTLIEIDAESGNFLRGKADE